MESKIHAAMKLVTEELIDEVRNANASLERTLNTVTDRAGQAEIVKNLVWDARYHGRRMARLANAVQMLESLTKGF